MKLLVVPVPLFDGQMRVEAYCFRFQKSDNLFLSSQNYLIFDGAMNSPMLELIDKIGLESLTTGKPIFVPISHISLLVDLREQCKEPPEKIVFVLDREVPVEKTYLDRICYFKSQGYRFACHSKIDLLYHAQIIALCDYIFIDAGSGDLKKTRSYLRTKNDDIKIIVSDIESQTLFNRAKLDGFSLFEGSFYRLPMTKGQNVVSPLKVNYVRLLNIVRDENFDLGAVSAIIRQDTALAISLLQLVNSLGLSQKISSISHAATLLGQLELRKWIMTAVTKMLSADKPNEITKLSLIRAKFAENLAPKYGIPLQAQSLFLTGLFSLLDIILGMTMESALNVVQVSDPIRDALLHKTGEHYKLLEFVLYYESADWVNVSRELIINRISSEDAFSAYFDALSWYCGLIGMDVEELKLTE